MQDSFRSEVRKNATEYGESFPESGLLCHYTTPEGLQGILREGSLWATNVQFTNDPEEFKFAYKLFKEVARKILTPDDIQYFINGLDIFGEEHEQHRVYFISFSENQDDLSQFRAYSNNGNGYALVFRAKELVDALSADVRDNNFRTAFSLRRALYGEGLLRESHTRVLDLVKANLEKCDDTAFSPRRSRLIHNLAIVCQEYLRESAVVFKQSGYHSENEFRAVLDIYGLMDVLPPQLQVRIKARLKGGVPIPYLPINFSRLLEAADRVSDYPERGEVGGLSKIVVGPGFEFEMAKAGFFYLLRDHGYIRHSIRVEASKSSYRVWPV